MLNLCTLFDSFYLSRGLALYESLKKTSEDFHLYIFAFDNLSLKILDSLNLEKTTLISLEQFENQDLLKVKPGRTKAEYCWTCTSSTISYVLENYQVNDCTYIDADLFFYKSPAVLLEEINSVKTVLITEHRYSWFAKMYEEKRAGRFCVQFITFTNSKESKVILNKWINQCIDWCFDRYEDGKFGDQKYLDEWPALYSNVKISEHKGGGVAPWNVRQYKILNDGGSLTGVEKKTGKKFDLIFYHFHFVRFLDNGNIDLGWNALPGDILKKIYLPYINAIIEIERNLKNSFPDFKTKYYNIRPEGLKESVKHFIKSRTKFNLIKP